MDDDRDLFDALDYPYDFDDPPAEVTPSDLWWGTFNRFAEECARYARLIGLI